MIFYHSCASRVTSSILIASPSLGLAQVDKHLQHDNIVSHRFFFLKHTWSRFYVHVKFSKEISCYVVDKIPKQVLDLTNLNFVALHTCHKNLGPFLMKICIYKQRQVCLQIVSENFNIKISFVVSGCVAGGWWEPRCDNKSPTAAIRRTRRDRLALWSRKKEKGGQIQSQSEIRANYVAIYASAPSRSFPTQPTK
jgi:hypothetical protein